MEHLTQRIEVDIKDIVAEIESEQELEQEDNNWSPVQPLVDQIIKSGFSGEIKRVKEATGSSMITIESDQIRIKLFFSEYYEVIAIGSEEHLDKGYIENFNIEKVIAYDRALHLFPSRFKEVIRRWDKKNAKNRISFRNAEINDILSYDYYITVHLNIDDIKRNISKLTRELEERQLLVDSFTKILNLRLTDVVVELLFSQVEYDSSGVSIPLPSVQVLSDRDNGKVTIKLPEYLFRNYYRNDVCDIIVGLSNRFKNEISMLQEHITYWCNEPVHICYLEDSKKTVLCE